MPTTRERILVTAADLFSDQGYDGTSLREIADRMGFTKAALYYHFQSKEEILRALLEPIIHLQEEMAQRLESAGSLEQWGEALTWAVDLMFENLGVFTLLVRNRAAVQTLAEGSDFFGEHQRWHERIETAVGTSGRTLDEQVRMVCALGAIGGFDDFGARLLTTEDPLVVRVQVIAVMRQILGLPKARRVAKAVPA